ncbi:efflux RND transporter periplasmic adaptor subunit [Stutzerimonas tarimensis]|uniref:Efflux RND transporter periplasmic adaptor subunit n=1 Tax=Stutzerimonas tarimensis TaxID=1507735 RepID=A0ABV7TE76_9GAMM
MKPFSLCRAWLLPAVLALVACNDEQPQQNDQPPPLPEVTVVEMRPQPLSNVLQVPGRVQAVRTAEIRARVSGVIQRRLYEEGTDVEAGQQLFQIDPREMQAALNAAQATLERAEATETNAARDVQRYRGLVQKQAISQQEFDTAEARLRTARADVSQAKAAIETAKLNLEYTRVETPIAGLAGRAEVTEGALVSAANGTLLTRVEQFDPVYVNFSRSSADLLALRAEVGAGTLELPGRGEVEVNLILENGMRYPHTGYVNFLAMTIDESTGTVALRAEVPNPDRLLLPGQFVQAQILAGTRREGLAVPQRAVSVTNRGGSVLVLDEENRARNRQVELGDLRGDQWLIRGGLEPGDRVVVDRGQSVREGVQVQPQPLDSQKAGSATATDEADNS